MSNNGSFVYYCSYCNGPHLSSWSYFTCREAHGDKKMNSTDNSKPDLTWAKEHIKGFADLKSIIDKIKADEAKYKAGDHSHRSQ